jgi:peptidoglycan/xylan/chitin deacetylase (PgdA/CDA1 family)
MEQAKCSACSAHRFIMSVDVDGWPSLLRFYSVEHDVSVAERQVNVEEGIDKLLNLFEEKGVRATFFVTGEMGQRHPIKVGEIAKKGHEVACHGFLHERDECLLSAEQQKSRIEKAMTIIGDATGQRPTGFRAPCLRANNTTLEILCRMGFLYDSSYLPMLIPGHYGSLSLKRRPYYFVSKWGKILEIPISTNPIFPLPLSASWMRNLGPSHVKLGIKMLFGLGYPVMLYIHPRDVLNLPPTQGVPWHLYRNTGSRSIEMLDEILSYVEQLGGRILRAIDFAAEFMKTK